MLSSSSKLGSAAGGSFSLENSDSRKQKCSSAAVLRSALSIGCLSSHQGAEPESEHCRVSGEARTGKWRVPTYKDYLDLFRNLLSCDQMTVKTTTLKPQKYLSSSLLVSIVLHLRITSEVYFTNFQ